MHIPEIFKKITPLQNQYKKVVDEKRISLAIELMWEIGGVLEHYINVYKLTHQSLFREIYGKSEGTKNITQRSYISRDFQSRCLRVRKIFQQKADISNTLPKPSSISPFIKAMPFFDNPKYELHGKEKKILISLLNSDLPPSQILISIKKMQNDIIGINNPRDQHLNELEKEKNVFIDFYNHSYRLIVDLDYDQALLRIDKQYYLTLSRNISALSQDGLKTYDFQIPTEIDTISIEFGQIIKDFLNESTPVKIRRFRRLIPPKRMVQLAEMLYAFSSKSSFKRQKEMSNHPELWIDSFGDNP